MSNDEYTRFSLDLAHFTVELAGEKTFVEELYRRVYRDLLPLMSQAAPNAGVPAQAFAEDEHKSPRMEYTWIYSCTPHYNKVYVVENAVISHSVFGRVIDPRRVRRIHLDRSSTLFKELSAGNRTLWAVITPEGRRMIEAASKK